MRYLTLAAAVGAAVVLAAGAGRAAQNIPGSADDFESYAVGTQFNTGSPTANDTWGDSNTYAAGYRTNTVEVYPLGGNPNNQVNHTIDLNQPGNLTKNTHLRTDFFEVHSGTTSGAYDVSFDFRPMRGAVKAVLTRGGSWTSGTDWVAALAFDTPTSTFFPGMSHSGNNLGYQQQTVAGNNKQPYVDAGATYTPGDWYSVLMHVDVDNFTYSVAIGPYGGPLTPILTDMPWIVATATGLHPSTFGGLYFATSNVKEEEGEFMLDNVRVVPEPSSVLAMAAGLGGLLPIMLRRK
ncbi:MAG: PEP-CTERM sorting domain-containing protein [Armatimonadetes bacterium]|nr:PEP-CTERM sorting domain-containing protein [Armatimonadota bacterium]